MLDRFVMSHFGSLIGGLSRPLTVLMLHRFCNESHFRSHVVLQALLCHAARSCYIYTAPHTLMMGAYNARRSVLCGMSSLMRHHRAAEYPSVLLTRMCIIASLLSYERASAIIMYRCYYLSGHPLSSCIVVAI